MERLRRGAEENPFLFPNLKSPLSHEHHGSVRHLETKWGPLHDYVQAATSCAPGARAVEGRQITHVDVKLRCRSNRNTLHVWRLHRTKQRMVQTTFIKAFTVDPRRFLAGFC